jgi:cysteine desulfurase
MGVDDGMARAAIRVSLGWTTTDEDVARFVEAWAEIHRRHGRSSDAGAVARPSQPAATLVQAWEKA